MAAKTVADIKPTGLNQADLVELMYDLMASVDGLCAKLDADGTVNDTDYNSLVYDAAWDNVIVENLKGERKGAIASNPGDKGWIISPNGVSDIAMLWYLYGLYYAMSTLCAKLDDDSGVADENYTTLCYTPYCTYQISPNNDSKIGADTTFWFRPGGVTPQKETVDLLYDFIAGWQTLCQKLDNDGGVADTDYEDLWYTPSITITVENSEGQRIGN